MKNCGVADATFPFGRSAISLREVVECVSAGDGPQFPPSFILHLSFLNVCLNLLCQRGLYHRPQEIYLSDPGRYTSLSFSV